MGEHTLDELWARLEALAVGCDDGDRRWAAHEAVLDRLARQRRAAQAENWTSLALERQGPRERFRLFGIPPGGSLRTEVPDTIVAPESDA